MLLLSCCSFLLDLFIDEFVPFFSAEGRGNAWFDESVQYAGRSDMNAILSGRDAC
jgi:hypothetical protein